MQPAIPVILGPTASGKTSVALRLAALIGGEIVSVDSRKVYRGLPVGTATPPGEWRGGTYVVDGIPHHLTAFLDPDQPYTAGDFAADASRLIADIISRNRVPVLAGGTGFYFKALQQGLPALPPRDPAIRVELERTMERDGAAAMHRSLAAIDPDAAAAIPEGDRHKIIRALEVARLTGRPFSEWKHAQRSPAPFRFLVMGVDFRKELLDHRIEARSRRMAEGGMIEETSALLSAGKSPDCPALASFGYREAVQVVEKKMDRGEFLARLIRGTKLYAKRQRTWFRTQVKPAWFMCDEASDKDEISVRMKALLYSGQCSNRS